LTKLVLFYILGISKKQEGEKVKLCFIGCWIYPNDPYKEYGAYILETKRELPEPVTIRSFTDLLKATESLLEVIKTGEPELRGFGASSEGLPKLAVEIKQLVKQCPKESIALRYEPPGTDIVTCRGDGSITIRSLDKDFRALNPDEIAQFRKLLLEAQ
jgi:hypothetical protein